MMSNMTNMDQLTQLTALLEQFSALGERFVLSLEKIAASLAGVDETYKRQIGKQYPERTGEIRNAVVSRVPTQEDRAMEEQGASNKPIDDWLSEPLEDEDEDEDLGVREREWLTRNLRK